MSYFNEDQQSYMRYIFSVPREKRCDCGWYLLGECNHPTCEKVYAAAQDEARAWELTQDLSDTPF